MNRKLILIMFLILLLASTFSVFADEEHDDRHDEGILTLDGYEIGLATEPESPKVGEVHLVVHIEREGKSIPNLHVEIKIAEMEMHSGEMEEHMVLSFEDGHAHEESDEPGHYAVHHMFEEEGTYMIRVKIEGVGATGDAFHVTVGSSFQKSELTFPLVFITTGIGVAALVIVGAKMRGA